MNDIQRETILSCLERSWEIEVVELTPLVLGADFHTFTYRVQAKDNRDFFLKVREKSFEANSVKIPAMLSEMGMKEIFPPIPTLGGKLWAQEESLTFILYPFVSGVSGWERDFSKEERREFGSALRLVHETPLSSPSLKKIPEESYGNYSREKVKAFLLSSPEKGFAREFHFLMKEREDLITHILERAETLGKILQREKPENCLCHGDIHAGNILFDFSGGFYLVDWDTLILAPKERDLMFIGAGVGGKWNKTEEEKWFYEGYGDTAINQNAFLYYRFERIVQDMAEFADFLTEEPQNKEKGREVLSLFQSQFEEGNVVSMALEKGKG